MIRRLLAFSLGRCRSFDARRTNALRGYVQGHFCRSTRLRSEECAARAERRLKRKANLWARWNGLDNVEIGRVTTGCSTTGPVVECKSVALVRG